MPPSEIDASLERLNRWNGNRNGEDPVEIRKALQECMQHNFSVFREGDAMAKGLEQLKAIRERLKNARLDDTSSEFNTQRVECLELDNLMETAFATAMSANFRTESRGAHSRFDFPDRDDENWLCHSLYLPESETMTRRSVNMNRNCVRHSRRDSYLLMRRQDNELDFQFIVITRMSTMLRVCRITPSKRKKVVT
ncbi:hypothetical protein ACNKHO_03830 [Shigella flexneri]